MSVNQQVLVDLLGCDGALLRRGKWLVEHEDSSLVDCAFNLQICHPSFGALMTVVASLEPAIFGLGVRRLIK